MVETVVIPAAKGPCRICGDPSWMADESGPAHPCCVLHAKEHPGQPCIACATSKSESLRRSSRPKKRRR
jgi:hypothetical protein